MLALSQGLLDIAVDEGLLFFGANVVLRYIYFACITLGVRVLRVWLSHGHGERWKTLRPQVFVRRWYLCRIDFYQRVNWTVAPFSLNSAAAILEIVIVALRSIVAAK